MVWDNVIGHGWAVEVLRRQVGAGDLRHAYLFLGPDRIGKRTLAQALASAILCPDPPQPGVPCGSCGTCRQAAAGAHPDLHLIRVPEDASSIGIDQIRELQGQIALSPYQAEHRVVLIEDAAGMTTAASNALLKTLEEPPPNVILILLAEATEQLLATIASRCTHFPLRPVTRVAIMQALENLSEDREAVALAAALSSGRPGAAIELLQDEAALPQRLERIQALLTLIDTGLAGRFAFVSEQLNEKTRQANAQIAGQVLEDWLSVWRDVLLARTGVETPPANPDFREAVQKLSGRLSEGEILRVLTTIRSSLGALKGYGNPGLALEVVLLDTPGWPG